MPAAIAAIDYHLPTQPLGNSELAALFPEWPEKKLEEKIGIRERRIAAPGECASDLGVAAAEKLFASGICAREEIDFLLFCTQSPDYFLPTTACLMQHRLGLPTTTGALDFNLGCSGFVYGLGLAKGLIETGQARTVLLIMAETYSKFIHPEDKSVRTIFGDAAAATLVRDVPDASRPCIGPFVYGTDGAGANNLIVPQGGLRNLVGGIPTTGLSSASFGPDRLFMNGPEIFSFTSKNIPKAVTALLDREGTDLASIDLFVFHQANRHMLEHLRKKIGIPEEKFVVFMEHCGNTVSATIPIALKHAVDEGQLRPGMRVMLVGFGVGYSWGATLLTWQ
jgi:3-oxoacyl-[acyl-carrier-protein] synthase III